MPRRTPAPRLGAKRQSTDNEPTPEVEGRTGTKRARTSKSTGSEASTVEQRSRLTETDLEFDYDRSELRDPRPTPGRVRRPRLEGWEVTDEFKQRFFIPKAERRKADSTPFRRTSCTKNKPCSILPQTFHDLYVCHKNGPRGPPTYDSAGFQLDFSKVSDWMKPKSYSKERAVGGMERALNRAEREERELFAIFFDPGDQPSSNDGDTAKLYVKDHISKDLGVPWHQIDTKKAREWLQRGFQKKKFSEWWREPNEEERKRMMKMMGGASLRKDL